MKYRIRAVETVRYHVERVNKDGSYTTLKIFDDLETARKASDYRLPWKKTPPRYGDDGVEYEAEE